MGKEAFRKSTPAAAALIAAALTARPPYATDGRSRTDAPAGDDRPPHDARASRGVFHRGRHDRPRMSAADTSAAGPRAAPSFAARGFFVFVRRGVVAPASVKPALPKLAGVRDGGGCANRALAALVAMYLLALAVIYVSGCAPAELKTARPGIGRASGTAQSLQGQLDTIEYHGRKLREELR